MKINVGKDVKEENVKFQENVIVLLMNTSETIVIPLAAKKRSGVNVQDAQKMEVGVQNVWIICFTAVPAKIVVHLIVLLL